MKAQTVQLLVCPEIVCVRLHAFRICCNLDCKKKLLAVPGQACVTCNACKRKMLQGDVHLRVCIAM